jgi:nitrogen fixation/metabolism regulation signal transduction histidine kinase
VERNQPSTKPAAGQLRAAADKGASPERIRDLVERLYRAMRPVTNLLKNPTPAMTSASALIKEAIFSAEIRLERHKVTLINGLNEGNKDFRVHGSKQMLVASITNLIDNSIHWLESKNPEKKFLYVGTTYDIEGGPSIIVSDNGPGFGADDPDDLITPFFSRRVGGMGLGLYIVNEVMNVNKGRLLFPMNDNVELPDVIDGAVVALQFSEV